MLDHAGFAVSDYRSSKSFYERALAPLGITLVAEPSGQAAGFVRMNWPSSGSRPRGNPPEEGCIAFRADDRESVDRFHAAALEAGATDNGAPGKRTIYHPHYYGAYVLDPDGNNIEAVCHRPE